MNREEQKAMIAHYVGHKLPQASLTLGEDGVSAQQFREALIKNLESLGEGVEVREVIDLTKSADWSTMRGLDSFRREYERINIKYVIGG